MKALECSLCLVLFIIVSLKSYAQEITVFPSLWKFEYYQDDQEITKKELKNLFSKNEEVNILWKKANTKEVVAGVAAIAQFAGTIWGLSELLNDDPMLSSRDKAKNSIGPIAGSLGVGIIGAVFLNSANKSRKRAILTYNKQFDSKTTFRVETVSSVNGLGLALKF